MDLSSDENDADLIPENIFQRPRQLQMSDRGFKKPNVFVDVSDDDDDDDDLHTFIQRTSILSSTMRKDKPASPTSSHSKSTTSSMIIPNIKPINSLQERQNSKNCLKDNAIDEIIKKFKENKLRSNLQITQEILK